MSDSEKSLSSTEDDTIKFAAVKFLCEENRKVHYVGLDKIENFDLNDFSKPKRVHYKIDSHGEIVMEPAQILAVAENVQKLKEKSGRYKFWKMRRSDAIHILAQENEDKHENKEKDDQVKVLKKGKKVQHKENTPKESDFISKLDVLEKQPLETRHLSHAKEKDNTPDEKDKLILELRSQIKSLLGSAYTDAELTKLTMQNNHKKIQETISVHSTGSMKGNSFSSDTPQGAGAESYSLINRLTRSGSSISVKSPMNPQASTSAQAATKTTPIFSVGSRPGSKNITPSSNSIAITPTYSGRSPGSKNATQVDFSTPKSSRTVSYGTRKRIADNSIARFKEKLNLPTTSDKDKNSSPIRQQKNKNSENSQSADSNDDSNDSVSTNDSPVMQKRRKMSKKKVVKTEKFDPKTYENSDDEQKSHSYWYKNLEGFSNPIKMIHLHYGVSVTVDCYNSADKQKTNSQFVRELAIGIWGRHALRSKALDVTKARCELRGETSRDPLTPRKEAALSQCYEECLNRQGLLPKISEKLKNDNPVIAEEMELKAEAMKKVYRQDLRFLINTLRSNEKRKEEELKEEERRQKKLDKKKRKNRN